jgi:Tfp pilus assembly protein PilO
MAIQLSKQQQQYLAVGVVAGAAFIYVYYAFVYQPIAQKLDDVKSQIADVEKKIDEADREARSLPGLQRDLEQLQKQAVDANRMLPQKSSVADILVAVTHLSQEYGVTLMSFKAGTSQAKSFATSGKSPAGATAGYTEIRYNISVRGSFHDIGKFLAALALQERLFNVKDVNYPGYGGEAIGGWQMPVNFTLIAYEYKG